MRAEPTPAIPPAIPPAAAQRRDWRWFVPRVAVTLATILWLPALGRLGWATFAQPTPWQPSAWSQPGSQRAIDPRDYRCRLNAFQDGDLVYRWCDRDDGWTYLIAFDPPRRVATIRWELPREDFYGADWFEAFAPGPAGEFAILGNRTGGVALLRPDGTTEALPRLSTPDISYGFGWQGGQLGLVSATPSSTAPAQLVTYRPGAGWSAPQPLPGPDCGPDATCTILVATPAPEGWTLHYLRAPGRPADPARIAAEVLRVGPDGATRVVQTLPLAAGSRAFEIKDGALGWYARIADRSGGNVLNYSGQPVLRQLPDGTFQPLPLLPVGLFLRPDERFVPTNTFQLPRAGGLTDSYKIAGGRLLWLPTYSRGGDALDTDRAVLFDERWLVLREGDAGLSLEERATDDLATVLRSGPLVLGRQADALDFSGYTSPLLRATDGASWLVGRYGDLVHVGPDLRRLDQHGPPARAALFVRGFTGFYRDDFHREWSALKLAAVALALFLWPLAALLLLRWRRRARPDLEDWWGVAGRTAAACAVLGALCLPWYWIAVGYF